MGPPTDRPTSPDPQEIISSGGISTAALVAVAAVVVAAAGGIAYWLYKRQTVTQRARRECGVGTEGCGLWRVLDDYNDAHS